MASSNGQDGSVEADLREKLSRLESRLLSLEKDGRLDSLRGPFSHNEVDETSSIAFGESFDKPNNLKYIPGVRKCKWAAFKNRFGEEDSLYAVDVLVSGSLFEQEYAEERQLRDRLFERGPNDAHVTKRKAQALVKETIKAENALQSDQSHYVWNQRIRIQAPALLSILAHAHDESWSSTPRTYGRPFTSLIYYQPAVKRVLADLEERLTMESDDDHTLLPHDGSSPRATTPPLATDQAVNPGPTGESSLDEAHDTLQLLRAYVKFMDDEVIPESQQFENLDDASEAVVRWSDLSYLFSPGVFIYYPFDTERLGVVNKSPRANMGERLWRVFMVNNVLNIFNPRTSDHEKYATHELEAEDSKFFTVCTVS